MRQKEEERRIVEGKKQKEMEAARLREIEAARLREIEAARLREIAESLLDPFKRKPIARSFADPNPY